MAKKRTYIGTDEELILQGKLIVNGDIIQRQYNLDNDTSGLHLQSDDLYINTNGFSITGDVSNSTIHFRSGDANVTVAHNDASGIITVSGGIEATEFIGNLNSNINVTQIDNFEPEVRQRITVNDPTASALSYSNATGIIDYIGVDQADIMRLSSVQTVTGDKTFTGTVDLTGATVPGFTVNGNLNIVGELNSITQTDLYVENNSIVLNKGNVAQNASIVVDRIAPNTDSSIQWLESSALWSFSHPIVASKLQTPANLTLTANTTGSDQNWIFTTDGRIIYPDGSVALTSTDSVVSEGFGIAVSANQISVKTTDVVTIADIQTVTGDKTYTGTVDFSSATLVGIEFYTGGNGIDITAGEISIDTTETVSIADNQTISGDKTFTGIVDFSSATLVGVDTYTGGFGIDINNGVIETNNADILALIGDVSSSITLNDDVTVTSESTLLDTGGTSTIASFSTLDYSAAKYTILAKNLDSGLRQVSEMLIVYGNSTATATEYGTITTGVLGDLVATYEVGVSALNVVLNATPTLAGNIAYTVSQTLMA